MKKNVWMMLVGCCFSGLVCAQNGPRNTMENFPEAVPSNRKVQMVSQDQEVYRVKYIKDVVYATRDGVDLKLQVMLPEAYDDPDRTYPCVVYVKGSAWMKQDIYSDVPQISRLARRGYVTAIVEYRHTGIAVFPAQRNDAIAAVEFMKAHADQYHLDKDNVFVWGASSGAHTALFTGLHLVKGDTLPDIRGIIAYFPPTDVLRMKDDPTAATTGDANSPEGLLIGKVGVTDAPEKAKAASPYYYIDENRDMPPVFLAHGTKDRVVPFSQSDLLANKLEEDGVEYEFYALRNADHGSWQFWTDEMFDRIEAFIRKHLSVKK